MQGAATVFAARLNLQQPDLFQELAVLLLIAIAYAAELADKAVVQTPARAAKLTDLDESEVVALESCHLRFWPAGCSRFVPQDLGSEWLEPDGYLWTLGGHEKTHLDHRGLEF